MQLPVVAEGPRVAEAEERARRGRRGGSWAEAVASLFRTLRGAQLPQLRPGEGGRPARLRGVVAEPGAGRRPRRGLGPGGARAAVAAADL